MRDDARSIVREAYRRGIATHDAMVEGERFPRSLAHETEARRYWKRFGNRENAPLVMFLEAHARALDEGGDETSGAYAQALRNAAKACSKTKQRVWNADDARALRGIGPRMGDVIDVFFRLGSAPTVTEYGETLAARNFGASIDRFAASSTRMEHATSTSGKRGGSADASADDENRAGPAPKRAKATTTWVPGYRTAAFALLVTMHKLALQGREVLTKRDLEEEAEISGLSASGIKPRAPPGGPAHGGGRGSYFSYCGWNSFNRLKAKQNGYVEPMVHTWKNSYTMQIRLSKTGTELAEKLHAAAEARGDCVCGLWRGEHASKDPGDFGGVGVVNMDEDDQLEVLDDTGAWTPVSSQQQRSAAASVLPPSAAMMQNAKPLSNLVSPSRTGWTLPPLEQGETYADRYDTVLVIYNKEPRLLEERQLAFFHNHGVKTLRSNLEIGDFAWVACPKGSEPGIHNAYVLDFLIERKDVGDLQASITHNAEKGKRYDRQKYRMKNYSGLTNLAYLIEGDLSATSNVGQMYHRPEGGGVRRFAGTNPGTRPHDMRKRLLSARVQTEIFDGFKVINTMHFEDTKRLLKNITLSLHATYGPLTRAKATKSARTYAQYDKEYRAALMREDSVKITWMSMLAQIDGLGPEKAAAIVEQYPTPYSVKVLCDRGKVHAVCALQCIQTAGKSVGPAASEKLIRAFFPTCE